MRLMVLEARIGILSMFPPPPELGFTRVRHLDWSKSDKSDFDWGRVREGGKQQAQRFALTPLPALRADLPHKGGGEERMCARELRLGDAA